MKLTIGMIVKNEEQYLERCLSSIKPILDSVDSELIITDTGSTDKTVEIAEKYTDKVLHFDWVNDFAAARNYGLEKARGEWFMAVDGDDIWEDCTDIIGFFNSGEYRKYHSAAYIYRNIKSLDNHTFSDQRVVRMAELTPDLRYVGKIHENLFPLRQPIRILADIVDHYGYLYDDNENMASDKAYRNEKLLLEELASTPENDESLPFLYFYLFEAMRNVEPQKAEVYLNTGIETAMRLGSDNLIPLLTDKIGMLFPNDKYEELIELCQTYFELETETKTHYTADAEMYAAKALSLSNLRREGEAYPVYEKFFDAFGAMKNSGSENQDIFMISPVLSGDANFLNVVKKYMVCCIETNRLGELSARLERTDLKNYPYDAESISFIIENETALLAHLGFDKTPLFYENLNEQGRTILKNSLCSILFFEGRKSEIIGSLSVISKDDPKLSDKLEIYREYFVDKAVSEDIIVEYAEKHGMDGNHDLMCIMMQCGMDISRLFGIGDFDPIICVKRCSDYICGFYETAAGYDVQYITHVTSLPAAAKLYEYIIKCALASSHDIDPLIVVYGGIGKIYFCMEPTEDAPPEIKSAYIFSEIQSLRRTGDFRKCFAELKNAVSIYPNISPVVAAYRDILSAEYEKHILVTGRNPEMERLAVVLKSNVRKLAANGDTVNAEKILNEYSSLNPSDPEIEQLYNIIRGNDK